MARTTKKNTYASYGIQYDTKTEKILSPIGWIPRLLVDGNEKIGRGVWHFSTLPGTVEWTVYINGVEMTVKGTCPVTCEGCYAMAGNFRKYQDTRDSLGLRTIIARDYLEFAEKAINAQIAADKIKIIRIHASGDFFSMAYAEMWKRIAASNPNVLMWTYTKQHYAESIFNGLDNANIVKSIIPGKGVNFGHCAYILALYEYLKDTGKKVYICRCGIDKNQHCTNCHSCAVNDFVLFLEHSTGYNASADPLFPVLKALIESQPAQN